jgi:SNF family Na+-dependent transporter
MRSSDKAKILGLMAIVTTFLVLHYYGNVAILEYLREQQTKAGTIESAE